MKILFLSTGAFGFTGGISEFDRNFLTSLCKLSSVEQVCALSRNENSEIGELPEKLDFNTRVAGSKLRYLLACLSYAFRSKGISLIFCGHINLLPFAFLVSSFSRAPVVLMMHGIEVWSPKGAITRFFYSRVLGQISVSELTLRRLKAWAAGGPTEELSFILPNAVDMQRFSPATKSEDLLKKYKLQNKKVILTVARLVSRERQKGIDEVLEVLPEVLERYSDTTYLIVGRGADKKRLEEKVQTLGLREHVVFAGYIPEEEKAGYYNLADVFVMPSAGEGFGIVYLEAMACGVPVIAGDKDGAQEALRGGSLGVMVNPEDAEQLRAAIVAALDTQTRKVPEGLEYFAIERFDERVAKIMEKLGTCVSGSR